MRAAVFLDTCGLQAVWDRRDQWHRAATRVYAALAAGRVRLVTTPAVLLVCGNAAARTPMRPLVVRFRDELVGRGNLIEPTGEDLAAAWAAYDRGEAGDAGIVDQISFAVMRRLGLTEAFTNDAHFRAAGFVTLF